MMHVAAFDVSKLELELCHGPRGGKLRNDETGIVSVLDELPAGCTVAMEASGSYHLQLAHLAHARGFRVVVANPRRVNAFVRSTRYRGKTDRTDARAIALYVQSQSAELRDFAPPPQKAHRVRELTRKRQALTSAKASLLQSLGRCEAASAACVGLDEGIGLLERELATELADVPEYKLLLGIPGVGPTVAAGLLGLLMSYDFASSDSFVAYLGMDPRPNDSGAKTGRRYISSEGDALARRLAYLAGLAALRTNAWKPYAQRQRAKGLPGTAVALIVGRKIARATWSIYKHKKPFSAERISSTIDTEP
jgi:transposase